MSLHWVTEAMWKHATVLQGGLWLCQASPPTPVSQTLQPLSLEREGRLKMAAEMKQSPMSPHAFPVLPGTC